MTALLFLAAVAATLDTATPAPAQAPRSELAILGAPSVDIGSPTSLGSFELRDTVNSSTAPATFTIAEMEDGKPTFRAHTPKGSANQYAINVSWRSTRDIKTGDVLLVRFAARAIEARQETGEAEGLFFFQAASGGDSDITQSFRVGSEWTDINVRFVAKKDHPAGQARLAIAFANLPQTIEFKSLGARNFGGSVALSALPVTRFSYAGREPDAVWRKDALDRIQALRTTSLTIRVVDRGGRPLSDARVQAQMTRSAFLWGTAVTAERIVERSTDADQYRAAMLENFDAAVFDNGLKWASWRNRDSRSVSLTALQWLAGNGIAVKGHNLAWTAWKFTPPDIANDPHRCSKIEGLVDTHIRDIAATLKGRLIGWDVVNEPVHETGYWECMPREAAAKWFKIAAAVDPQAKLTLNEYGMLNRSSSPLMIADLLEFSRMLKRNGARVDVLGVQGHIGQTPRPPVGVLSDLDLLAADGQQVQITEFDFNTPDEVLQADYTRDFLIAIYSHKAVTGYFQWGFWERDHWKPAAAMLTASWREKLNFKVWQELVRGQWRTRVDQRTGLDGIVRSDAHLGTYDIHVSAAGHSKKISDLEVEKGEAELVVQLEI